jgi:hypothetical protein
VGGDDGHWWNDDQLMTLLTEVLDGPAADCTEAPTSATPDDEPAEFSLQCAVAAGRAAFCWLDVIVTLRNVTRRLGPAAGTSTAYEPGH